MVEEGESAVGRNLLWLLLSQLATWSVSLVMVVAVPNLLGVDDWGSASFAGAFVGFFTLAAGLGTSTLMTREVARDHSLVGPWVVNALVMKVFIGIGLSIVAVVLAGVLGYSEETITLIAICCLGMQFILLNEVLFSALAGLERMGRSSAWTVVAFYVSSIAGVAVLLAGGGVVAFVAVQAASGVIPVVANAALLWPMVRHHFHLERRVWKHLIVAGLPLMTLAIINQIYSTIDVPLLGTITNTTTVGWYSLAYRWAGIPIFAANAVMASHFPQFSVHGKTKGPEFAAIVNRAVQLVLLVSIPAGVGLAVVASDLVSFYPLEFAPTVRPLQILAVQIPITAMDTILATALIASDRLRPYLWVSVFAAVLNPIACVVLINWTAEAYGNGAIGAAIATFGTELFVMAGALRLQSIGVMDRRMTLWTLRCVVAGAAIAVIPLVAADAPIAVKIGLGVAIYVAASLALRTVTPEMVRSGRRVVSGAFRRVRPRGRTASS